MIEWIYKMLDGIYEAKKRRSKMELNEIKTFYKYKRLFIYMQHARRKHDIFLNRAYMNHN